MPRVRCNGQWSGMVCAWMLCAVQVAAIEYPLRWRFSNPAPHGNNVVDMAHYTNVPSLWVQVAEQGQIYTSADLDLWIPRQSGTANALRGVAFFGSRVLVVGESGTTLWADDLDHFQAGTLVDGSTTDWLEAVTCSLVTAVAVGDNGAIYTSTSGLTWKRQTNNYTNWLAGVAWGGGRFVAVGDAGMVLTSNLGTNWTRQTNVATALPLHRVSFHAGRFTAVGAEGVTVYSTNGGVSWSPEFTGASNDLEHAATANSARVVVGYNEVRLFDNGAWTNAQEGAFGPPNWTYYAAVGRTSFFLLAGQTGMVVEGYKTNSAFRWSPSFDSVRHWLWDVVYAGDFYAAVGDFGTVMTSGDGVGWHQELVPNSVTNTVLLGVGGDTNLLLAVGEQGRIIASPNILTNVTATNVVGTNIVVTNYTVSSLGVLWYSVPSPTNYDLQAVAYHKGNYVIAGDHGVLYTSSNGSNWTLRSSQTTKLITSLASWPGGLVGVGDDGAIITSPNGVSWTPQISRTTNWLYRVRHFNGVLIAVGQNGTLLTSTNGVAWTNRVSGTTRWLTDVTQIDGTYFVIGTGGTLLTSVNLSNWVNRGTITRKSLYSAATDSRQLIAVGVEGVILRSPVLPDVTPMSILAYARLPSTNGLSVQNLFLFAGVPDQEFTLDYNSGLTTNRWITGPQLEFYDGSGTLFYLETISGTNAGPNEFYRATLLSP